MPLEEVLLVDLRSVTILYADDDLYDFGCFGCTLLGRSSQDNLDDIVNDDFVDLGQVLSALTSTALRQVVAKRL